MKIKKIEWVIFLLTGLLPMFFIAFYEVSHGLKYMVWCFTIGYLLGMFGEMLAKAFNQ